MPRSKEEKTTTSVIQRKLASKAAAIVWADAPYIKKFAGAVRQFFHALNCTRIQKLFFPGFWDWTPDTMIPVSLLNLRLSSRNKWSEIDKNIKVLNDDSDYFVCADLDMAPHVNKMVTGRWRPQVTSHCDKKRIIEIHLSLYKETCNQVSVKCALCLISAVADCFPISLMPRIDILFLSLPPAVHGDADTRNTLKLFPLRWYNFSAIVATFSSFVFCCRNFKVGTTFRSISF